MGNSGDGPRFGGHTRLFVILNEQVAIGGKDERNVVELADTVAFALLKTMLRRQALALGFNDCQRDGFSAWLERAAQDVVGPTFPTSLALTVHDVNRGRGFFDSDVRARHPTAACQRGVKQLEPCLGFATRHEVTPR